MQHTVSSKTLVKASLSAAFVAMLALIMFILPAEYNIDPTGVGHKLGLTVLAAPAATDNTAIPTSTDEYQVIEVTVPAGKGIEYKFSMQQYNKLTYEWLTDGPALFFDLHGEPQGDTTGYFESYAIATLNEMKGSFTAPFAGSHGWYWKNESDQPVAVQLMVKGQYNVIGLK
ncbi:hypothetical protein [Paraglaciecola sp.]|uniref:hypothetical protein n=1 Tax=Paraglaciecola sp. TaxID=1920173 RepID=UPI0030F43440